MKEKKLNILQKIFIKIIEFYQKFFSLDHSFWAKQRWIPYCKFFPTCSEYTKESIEKNWAIKWAFLWIWRILRCMPWSKWWYDPVEKEKRK